MFRPGYVSSCFENEGNGGGADTGGATDQNQNDAWFGAFSEPAQQIAQKNGWPDAEKAILGYGELEKLVGNPERDGYLKLPGEEDKWDDVWNKLGRPEEVGKYSQIKPPEGHIEGDPTDTWLRDAAYNAGLTDKQYQAVLNGYYNELTPQLQKDADAKYEAEVQKGETALREKWGTKYSENYATGNAFVKAVGITETEMAVLQEGLGTARVGELFLELGKLVMSDTGATTDLSLDQRGAGQNATWAEQEMNQLKADKDFMKAVGNGTYTEPKWTQHCERWNRANEVLQKQTSNARVAFDFGA